MQFVTPAVFLFVQLFIMQNDDSVLSRFSKACVLGTHVILPAAYILNDRITILCEMYAWCNSTGAVDPFCIIISKTVRIMD